MEELSKNLLLLIFNSIFESYGLKKNELNKGGLIFLLIREELSS